jgi:transcriptional regulator with XRE-family HTH domain
LTFGDYLISIREERDVSRRKLNELTGLSLSYLHEIETDRYLPGPDNLRKIAKALRFDVDELLRARDRIEFERMGLDPDATLMLKEMGELTDDERRRLVRLYRRIKSERKEGQAGKRGG